MCRHSEVLIEAAQDLQSILNVVAGYGTLPSGEIQKGMAALDRIDATAQAIDVERQIRDAKRQIVNLLDSI